MILNDSDRGGSGTKPARNKRQPGRIGGTALIACVQFYVALESSLLLPLGPVLSRALHFSPSVLGYLNGSFLIAAAIAGLIGSLYLDQVDRRIALAGGLAALAFCTGLAGFAQDFKMLILCRFLAGLCGGPVAALGLAVIGDTVRPELRARAMGTVAAGSGVAIILGVPIALTVADHVGWRTMLAFVGVVGLVLAILTLAFLQRGLARRAGSTFAQAIGEFRDLAKLPGTPYLLVATGTIFGSTQMLASTLAPYFVFNLGVSQSQLGYIWMTGGALGLVSSQTASHLAHRFGPYAILAGLSAFSVFIFFLLFVEGHQIAPVIILFSGFMICANGRIVMANTISSLASRDETRGRFMSLVSAVNQTTSAIALVIASLLLTVSPSGALVHVGALGLVGIGAAIISPLFALAARRLGNNAMVDDAIAAG